MEFSSHRLDVTSSFQTLWSLSKVGLRGLSDELRYGSVNMHIDCLRLTYLLLRS
jgi:hypothetical protein